MLPRGKEGDFFLLSPSGTGSDSGGSTRSAPAHRGRSQSPPSRQYVGGPSPGCNERCPFSLRPMLPLAVGRFVRPLVPPTRVDQQGSGRRGLGTTGSHQLAKIRPDRPSGRLFGPMNHRSTSARALRPAEGVGTIVPSPISGGELQEFVNARS